MARPAKPMFLPPEVAASDGAVSVKKARAMLGGIGRTKFYELVKARRIEVARIDGKLVVPRRQLVELVRRAIEEMRSRTRD
jgi:hypothetical protein